MKKFIGFGCIILGLITAIFGSLIITIFAVHDIIVNFDTLTGSDLFWDVVWILCRDVISIIIGVGLYTLGMYKLSS